MNIAVTGLNATDNPGPGVPVIRSIKEYSDIKGNIVGLIYDSLEPGVYMQNVADRHYLIPYPSSGLDNFFERIVQIHKKEKLDLIIPTLDAELYAFAKLSARLSDLGIRTFLPTVEQLNIRAKDKLFDFCSHNNIKVPKNITLTSYQDIYKASEDFEYPVVVKGIFYDAYISHNFEEALSKFQKLAGKWGYPIIIQEFISGDEFNVVALGDGEGNTVGAVPMRKLYITDKGKGWSGVTIDDKILMELSQNIIKKLKWKSGMELEYLKSKETKEYYLLEINPRFPAWSLLAPAAGQNLPAALVKLAMGENVTPYTGYEVGKMFVRSSWDLISDMKTFEKIAIQGEL